jgi:poly(3-hydroxybutyrate) depolymerase
MRLSSFAAVGLAFFIATAAARADCTTETLPFAGVTRSYSLCVPAEAKPDMPVLLLLHGSYGTGARIALLWQDFAARRGIILVAPDALHSDAWRLKDDSPDFLHAVVNEVQTRYSADRRRLYLFGQSGGAVYGLTLAMLESDYFAAIAIHAGAWRSPAEFKAIALARRRIPLKIIVGDKDEYFSATAVHGTKAALSAAGFPIEVEIVPGQHHGFIPEIAAATEESAWRFLAPVTLTANPMFLEYGD